MVSRTAARVGSRIDGVDDASGSASDRAAREAVRLTFVDQTLDRMRVRAAYRINAACDDTSGRCYGQDNVAGCTSLAMSEVKTYRA